MSIYDKASLVLIPSGTKTSKVYSQKPVNGDGDFTFSRSTAATRVNADGNIEKETQNLILNSQNFGDSQYVLGPNISRTTGQTDPNGGNTAVLMSNTGDANGYFYSSVSLQANTINTFSIYIKGSSAGSIAIRLDGSSQGTRYDVNYTTEWTRVSCYQVVDQTNCAVVIGGFNTWTVGENIQFAFAQVEQGLVARDYIETTTAAVEGGITDNVPRLDYTDSSCPALLLEPQRSNNVSHSEYHQGTAAAVTRTYNTTDTLSPEGYYNAVKYEVNANNSDPYLRVFSIPTSGNNATFSLYVKGASGQLFSMILGRDGYNELEYEAFALDGTWQRLTLSKTFTTTPTTLTIGAEFSHSSDDGVLGQEYYLYGLQCEAASYATSYIPTYGTSVTRNADDCDVSSVSSLLGQSEGVVYWEGQDIGDANSPYIGFYNNTTNRILIYYSGGLNAQVRVSSVVEFQSATASVTGKVKAALAYKNNDFAFYVNGVQISTSSSGSTFSATQINRIDLGYSAQDGGRNNKVMTFKTRLSNEELAALTTI